MKKCKYCHNDMETSKKICPNCNRKQPSFLLPIIIFFILITVIMKMLIPNNSKLTSDNIETRQKRTLQGTTQIALEDWNLTDDTSSKLDDWTINLDGSLEKNRWVVVTNSASNGRIKAIFEWTGNEDDDLYLKYLLVKGRELVNKLD